MHLQERFLAPDGRPMLILASDSRAGKGSASSRAGLTSSRATGRPRRVLVVEDNLDTVHSLAHLLKDDGHKVEFAINGYAAVQIARAFRPDVVLLDLGLPGMDGVEVCERIKAEPGLEATRVIAVTAYDSDEHRARARAAGCEMHILKPYDPVLLLSVVNLSSDKPPT